MIGKKLIFFTAFPHLGLRMGEKFEDLHLVGNKYIKGFGRDGGGERVRNI
jgi:hypothetical protein